MDERLTIINLIISIVGLIFSGSIIAFLWNGRKEDPVYSEPEVKKQNFIERGLSGMMRGRIKQVRHNEDQIWEISQNDRGRKRN